MVDKHAAEYSKTVCGKVISSKGNLSTHMLQHSSVKPFICETCGKGFSSKQHFIEHARRHTGERPYKCEFEGCNKTFRTYDGRTRHLVYHDDAFPFICDICGKQFKERSVFRNHKRTKHEVEYPWPCEYCPEKFKTLVRFKGHIARCHVDKTDEVTEKKNIKFWPCEHCEKVFGNKDDWIQHMNIHLGLRPFKCVLCEKTFSNKSNWMQHKRTHYKQDLLQCPECFKSYKDPNMFKAHLKNKHSREVEVESSREEEEIDVKAGVSDKAVDNDKKVYTSVYSPVAPLTPYDRRQADYSSIVNIWVPGSGMVPALSSEDNIFSNTEKSPC